MVLEHCRGGLKGIEKSVNWCLCGFAFEASKVQTVPAAERGMDLLDSWVVARCEGLPVGVAAPSPPLTRRDALHLKLPRPGSGAHSLCLRPEPAGGSPRSGPSR